MGGGPCFIWPLGFSLLSNWAIGAAAALVISVLRAGAMALELISQRDDAAATSGVATPSRDDALRLFCRWVSFPFFLPPRGGNNNNNNNNNNNGVGPFSFLAEPTKSSGGGPSRRDWRGRRFFNGRHHHLIPSTLNLIELNSVLDNAQWRAGGVWPIKIEQRQ